MDTGKWIDELTMLAFDDRGQFDVLESSLATCDKGSESTFLWQLAVGLAVDPASAVIDALHRSAVHSGNTIALHYRVIYSALLLHLTLVHVYDLV